MTGSWVGFGLLAAALLAPAVLIAADPSVTSPAASVALKDGRVLHNVKIMSDEGLSVILKADEGLIKVAKADLPPGLADAAALPPSPPSGPPQFVMQRFDPNQPPETPPPEPGAKPKAKPGAPAVPGPKQVASSVYKGCTIISFQMKSFQGVQGCAEVIIRNDTDVPVMIRPGEITCVTADGGRHVARNIITESFPPSVKRREFVPPRAELDDIFAFANEPLDISGVQWSR